jgi:hypothetical protein
MTRKARPPQSENSGQDQVRRERGRFVAGTSGNPKGKPKGARHRATRAVEALLEGEADALTRKAIELALEGDTTALRLCLERIAPAKKDAPVRIDLPRLLAAGDLVAATDAVLQAQDNREHDLLDSDDYYQFEGGLAAAVETLSGRAPVSLHLDSSRPEKPVARTLAEEIGRVVRARAANPKWIAGMMRHGYKGAFEMAATVDYLFAFAATTNAVSSHHFDQLYAAYLEDDSVRDFIREANPPALAEIAARLEEAIRRGLWQPASNSAHARLAALATLARPERHPRRRAPTEDTAP